MAGRSKWLDPGRIAHGVAWRTQGLIARLPRPSGRRLPPPAGDSFRRAVLASFEVDDIEDLDDTRRMWAEFTLTSLERGQRAVATMGGPVRFRGKRVLDVGCAYAGFLAAASQAGAREVVGIDVDTKLLDLGRLLLADHRVAASLHEADLVDPRLSGTIGQFDIVLCNDVLEHVSDLPTAAANLERLLRPGGRLFLEIPNGLFVGYLESDGHYKLPGITLLDHDQAERWFRSFYADAYPYRTFFYAPLDFYVSLFSRVGIPTRLLNAPSPDRPLIERLQRDWDRTRNRLTGLRQEHPDKPLDLVEEIERRSREVDLRFRRLLGTSLHSSSPDERAVAATTLLTTFGLDSYVLEGIKGARQG